MLAEGELVVLYPDKMFAPAGDRFPLDLLADRDVIDLPKLDFIWFTLGDEPATGSVFTRPRLDVVAYPSRGCRVDVPSWSRTCRVRGASLARSPEIPAFMRTS